MTIGEKIKDARQKKSLTQRKLAELLGYSGRGGENTIQKWEYGERPVPQNKLKSLSTILEIPLEELLP